MFTTRRTFLAGTAALAALAACKPAATPLTPAEALKAALDAAAKDTLAISPEFATSLAVSPEMAGGPFNNRLSDYSAEGLAARAAVAQKAVSALDAIDAAALTPADKVSLAVVRATSADAVAGAAFGYGSYGAGAPQPYVVTQIDGAYVSIPDFLDSQHAIANRDDAEAYISRLQAFARVLDQETARIGADAQKGVIPPDFIIDGAVKQLKAFASQVPHETVLVTSLSAKTKAVPEIGLEGAEEIAARAAVVVRDEVLPAYTRQIAALEAIRPQAVHEAGVWRLPQGAEMYKAALKAWTTTDLTPDQIHEMGLDLIETLTAEADAIFKAAGRTKGTVAQRIQALSKEPAQLYPNTDEGRAALLADLNAQAAAITARMPEQFGALAKAKLEIKRVPAYIEAGAPGGYYQPAALDGSRAGAYYINLRDTAEWPRFTLPTLTYHEGVPGHHWQNSLAQEAQGLPFIRSAMTWLSGYGEGWALYSEQLADEMGVYKDDPWGRIGYLQSMLFRACRLVVDTGMHHKQWSREQAIAYMVEVTGDQETAVTTEIERYCAWPGQACAYMVGRQEINRLRAEAKAALGEKFDQKAFHDTVLSNGAMPLSVMETVVKDWTAGLIEA